MVAALVLNGASACDSPDTETTAKIICTIAPPVLEVIVRDLELPNGLDNVCAGILEDWLNGANPFTVELQLPEGRTSNYSLPQLSPAKSLTPEQTDAAIRRLEAAMNG